MDHLKRFREALRSNDGPEQAAATMLADADPALRARESRDTARDEKLHGWEERIDQLERLSFWASELVADFAKRTVVLEPSVRRDVLQDMASWADGTANEVVTLLRTNHPQGALARWRRLHEYAVLASFLRGSDEETADMFIAHERLRNDRETVRIYRISKEYGYERDRREFVQAAQARIDQTLANYGPDFGMEFTWAHGVTYNSHSRYRRAYDKGRRRSPTMADLAELVGLAQFATDYSLASSAVHASTGMNGNVTARRAWHIAGHNSAYAIGWIAGHVAESEDAVYDDDVHASIRVVGEMAHQVALAFSSRGPQLEKGFAEIEQFLRDR
jgi:hypothetical protein